jgi:hypothetical protein
MPERPVLCAAQHDMLQVRKEKPQLQKLHLEIVHVPVIMQSAGRAEPPGLPGPALLGAVHHSGLIYAPVAIIVGS